MPRYSSSRYAQLPTSTPHATAQTTSTRKPRSSSCTLYTWLLSLLAVFLLGTVIVLSVVKSFFGVDWNDALSVEEVRQFEGDNLRVIPYLPSSDTEDSSSSSVQADNSTNQTTTIHEKIPRIIHQTWKTSLIPSKWAESSAACRAMHPSYEYKLWTDESSITFIKDHYPWFLNTFLNYKFNIQRADAIRYFVLHKYGGVYLDLDIGCRRPFDSLLNFQTILPATKPIGVSNDLMFSEANSPFMDSVIHNLVAFDHQYLSDYPTVMFSTGPMFLSAVLSLWNSKSTALGVYSAFTNTSDLSATTGGGSLSSATSSSSSSSASSTSLSPPHTIRILPRELYGKNIEPELVPDSFFIHYYGSSWHQNDSFIFTFLGTFGTTLMNIAFVVVLVGTVLTVVRKVRRKKNRHANGIGYQPLSTADSNHFNPGLQSIQLSDYDSDIEDGSRIHPSQHQQQSHSNRPISDRRRRKHYRRAMAAGARNWLFGTTRSGISGNSNTGGIHLPRRSSIESGSEDVGGYFYTSSSEDGDSRGDSRRGSLVTPGESLRAFRSRNALDSAGGRRANPWMSSSNSQQHNQDQDQEEVLQMDDGEEAILCATTITAPSLHRRNSSQPGSANISRSGTPKSDSAFEHHETPSFSLSSSTLSSSSSRLTPVPPGYLELPPPPPYRPPSPNPPISPLPPSNQERSWFTSMLSIIPSQNTASSSSRAMLPFFNSRNNNNNINNIDRRRASIDERASLAPPTRQYGDEERDTDALSLHSVKTTR